MSSAPPAAATTATTAPVIVSNDGIDVSVSCPDGLDESRVLVEWSRSFDRKLSPVVDAASDAEWARRLAANKRLFNGLKFRLHSAEIQDDGRLALRLGLTDYKSFIGINMSPDAASFRALGETDHGDADAYMGHALGVGAMVQTSDDVFLFIRRGAEVGEGAGSIDMAGGHPEPADVGMGVESTDADGDADVIRHELFASMTKEIVEEMNLPRDRLSAPVVLGIIRNRHTSGRSSLQFLVQFDGTADDAMALYAKGPEDGFESEALVQIPAATLLSLEEDCPLKHADASAPSARGAVLLWARRRSGSGSGSGGAAGK